MQSQAGVTGQRMVKGRNDFHPCPLLRQSESVAKMAENNEIRTLPGQGNKWTFGNV
jgi:hypothetical protein